MSRLTNDKRFIAAAILAFIQRSRECPRSDVIGALGLTVGQWKAGIRERRESASAESGGPHLAPWAG